MSRTSQLSRSDLVLWPIATEIEVPWLSAGQVESGLVGLNVSLVASNPNVKCASSLAEN